MGIKAIYNLSSQKALCCSLRRTLITPLLRSPLISSTHKLHIAPTLGSQHVSFRRPYHAPTIYIPTMAKAASFYMRELPKEHLIGYDTVEGKQLFKQALLEGGLEAFFPLSQQFLTVNKLSIS